MKTKFFFSVAVMAAIITGSLQKANAQNYWQVGGNSALQDLSIGQIGANGLNIITSNVPRIYVAPTGNVGIGTTTPWSSGGTDAKICQLAATLYPQYLLQATSGSTDNKVWRMIARSTHDFEIQTLSDNYGTEQTAMQINRNANSISTVVFPNGKVGIGTASPQALLDVYGDAHINGLTIGKGGNNNYLNSALGSSALYSNTSGIFNTAIGYLSLYSNTTGYYNTASGYQALYSNTTGNSNTANGYHALYTNTTGSNNSVLGFNAYPVDGTVSNYTGIGYNVGSGASASNEVEIGSSSVSVIRGQVNFSTYSDKRIKNTIQQNVPGLAFINRLTPVTYKLDIHKENNMLYAGKTINGKSEKDVDFDDKYDLEKKQMTGFLAQDVEAAAEAVHYDFSGVVKPRNDHDLYSLRYSDFVVPLVKGEQELSKQNDSLTAIVTSLQKQIDELKATVLSGTSSSSVASSPVNKQTIALTGAATLSQNVPNPFSHSTTISYSLPAGSSNAAIIFYDASGTMLKSEKLAGSSKGNITLQANELPSGVYRYVLFADGKILDSKQMMVLK